MNLGLQCYVVGEVLIHQQSGLSSVFIILQFNGSLATIQEKLELCLPCFRLLDMLPGLCSLLGYVVVYDHLYACRLFQM